MTETICLIVNLMLAICMVCSPILQHILNQKGQLLTKSHDCFQIACYLEQIEGCASSAQHMRTDGIHYAKLALKPTYNSKSALYLAFIPAIFGSLSVGSFATATLMRTLWEPDRSSFIVYVIAGTVFAIIAIGKYLQVKIDCDLSTKHSTFNGVFVLIISVFAFIASLKLGLRTNNPLISTWLVPILLLIVFLLWSWTLGHNKNRSSNLKS